MHARARAPLLYRTENVRVLAELLGPLRHTQGLHTHMYTHAHRHESCCGPLIISCTNAPQPAQIFANFGFMSILATVGTEKVDPKKKQGESKDEGGAQMMDLSP